MRVVLAGASGYGRSYLREVADLEVFGLARLAGVCEAGPIDAEGRALIGDRPVSADLGDLVNDADVVIVATPAHFHLPMALQALEAGAHLLLEKPPTTTFDGWRELVARAEDRVCQVGFQSLGSGAVHRAAELVRSGALGEVRGIGVRGTWLRDDAYYARAAWAGRRVLDGVAVVDGALTNPFAHAVVTALAVDGGQDVRNVELELLRARDVEADDTSCVRFQTGRGTTVVVAVTLCAETAEEPVLVVHGSQARLELHYTQDRLVVDGVVEQHGSVTPLRNLLDHVRHGAPLFSPLSASAGFMRVLEEVRVGPPPLPIHPAWLHRDDDVVHVRGVDAAVRQAADRLHTFAELDVPWSRLRQVAGPVTTGKRLPGVVPKPALHPVRTLDGVVVTDEHPPDHPWHRGMGLALSYVNGVNLWGGPTYLPGQGYVDRGVGMVSEAEPATVDWCDAAGRMMMRERRSVGVRAVAGGVEIRWRSDLTAAVDVKLTSPGSRGCAGAGYGGWFWRLPPLDPDRVEVFTPHHRGEDAVNGTCAEWLAVVVNSDTPWTAVLRGPLDPWFVRLREYQAIGSALAWDRPRLLTTGEELSVEVGVELYDGVYQPGR
ncbi:DUF6807 family protein [Lentzea flaviverrucosa]|uniref:Predicted dehydrogenase n=1 Tax=Lentzea flaviverrucosa TaxID=200379 RepID=A0A1H9XW44_9PSEU|nr:DUF6807 family protein [Lentzea flaviverrucosa]RDI34439.1 putative dehydrogenase [Lentzea flaviverrucosa]SES50390.1 Predicted dehydrogenase [Lentzea flaviverrucosa]